MWTTETLCCVSIIMTGVVKQKRYDSVAGGGGV